MRGKGRKCVGVEWNWGDGEQRRDRAEERDEIPGRKWDVVGRKYKRERSEKGNSRGS